MRTTIEQPKTPKSLKFLYCNVFGLPILRLMTARWVSRLAGAYLDSRLSRRKIKKYIKKHAIDMSDYIEEDYQSFNAFFTRRIKSERRPFARESDALVAPCDGKLTAYPIDEELRFRVKGFDYSVETLLRNGDLAREFQGGVCLVFRLTVTDYHRYFFFDDGTASGNTFIKGRLHTVQPAALEKRRVFTENCREYTVLETEHFGKAVQVEVGAMMVGRIENYHGAGAFRKGEEKGKFMFGGSTIVVLTQKNVVTADDEFLQNTRNDLETVVRCGEKIGTANGQS